MTAFSHPSEEPECYNATLWAIENPWFQEHSSLARALGEQENQISSRLASVLPNVLEGHEKCEPVPLSSHEISVQPTPEAEHQIVELELTPEPKSSDHTSEDSYDSYSCGSGRSTMAGHISKIVAAESHHECVTIEPLGISGPSDGRYGMSTMHTSPNHTYQIIIPPNTSFVFDAHRDCEWECGCTNRKESHNGMAKRLREINPKKRERTKGETEETREQKRRAIVLAEGTKGGQSGDEAHFVV